MYISIHIIHIQYSFSNIRSRFDLYSVAAPSGTVAVDRKKNQYTYIHSLTRDKFCQHGLGTILRPPPL